MQLKKASILVVDDDTDVLTAVRLLLRPQVKEIVTEKNPENIPSLLKQQSFDVILLDMNFASSINTGNEGLFWLKKIKSHKSEAAVIMITAYGDIDLAIRSLKEGAYDFVVKPWHNEKLLSILTNALDGKSKGANTPAPAEKPTGMGAELLGESDVMQDIFYKISKIAPTDANILILGENGTGKELIAKAIHQHSLRAAKPFVKVDVGALTESLFETELFGHKKGAFTDAREDRAGRFEAANKGTIFLDEIGNISLHQQSKLLSVLQNRQVIRVGANEATDIDVRLLCATNVTLAELANESRFRKDLVYRINTVEITVPPLRKRGNDIVLLAQHFSKIYADKYMKPAPELAKSAMEKLKSYHFPGNVRELQYAIERAVIMADTDVLEARDMLFSPIEAAPAAEALQQETNLEELEKATILHVLEKHGGNLSRASIELGITRTALYRRLSKYGL
ncbi:sigma-54-dependent transcriptional regulator [Pontibacter akesuensis]|uniref:DNA-binding transcriptional response regulator, NtrC family, contains REC, AAA-type ATPase, and a Fis-type DNA-binding domains n=1 Tax=Pontibacter akesuensis TaxID=388950 RepID=A0A1I7GMY6_9BACT|nr:sigma-54 dependent transcriptional regulator [Pontibacter akesuensis]GHA55940.1 sigma-54-dependent Fis family transcriptional regulator [Pontibacter akesuensis]SFU49794.1 DNA-binding transcriptional response regulator, NtrC family, contains REC, AAA-type ATPase, and a Fis-type DNA-binding domains [Pontibacter akesuensis]